MTYGLLFARDEMRKRHLIDKINDKTSKTMKNANCHVGEDDKFFACGLRDVDLIMCNKD